MAQSAKKPEMTSTGHLLGTQSRSGHGGLTSSMAKHVGRAAGEASALNQQRKVCEERALLRK